MKNLSSSILFTFFLLPLIVNAQPGSFDESFGTNGYVLSALQNSSPQCWKLLTDTIGNIYTAGYQMANTTSFSPVFMLAKYNYEGQLDTTFGNGGFVSAQPESGYNFCYTALCSGMEKLCSEEMHRIPRAGMTLQ